MVDHHVLNGDQDQEDHGADDVVAAHHEASEGFDHVARRRGTTVAVQQDQARGRDVQRQTVQGQQQQRGGKYVEVHGLADINRYQQYDDGQGDVHHDQEVQQERRHGHDESHHDRHHGDRYGHLFQTYLGTR